MRLLNRCWSLSFVLEHSRLMSLGSAVRYRGYVLRYDDNKVLPGQLIHLRMRRPFQGDVWLREAGSDYWTFREIAVAQVYGPVVRKVPGCAHVIDLGAHIGLAARYFAAAYPTCRLVAVEPDPGNACLLQRNLAPLVLSGRCRVKQAAVWGRNCRLGLAEPPEGIGFDAVRVSDRPMLSPRTVDAFTLAELIEQSGFPRVDLLKVDIEGAETELFQDAGNWIDRVGAIAVEFHGDSRSASGFDALMRRHGFAVDDSHRHTVLAIRS